MGTSYHICKYHSEDGSLSSHVGSTYSRQATLSMASEIGIRFGRTQSNLQTTQSPPQIPSLKVAQLKKQFAFCAEQRVTTCRDEGHSLLVSKFLLFVEEELVVPSILRQTITTWKKRVGDVVLPKTRSPTEKNSNVFSNHPSLILIPI